MAAGYIYVETRADRPGVVRVRSSPVEPAVGPGPDGAVVRYLAFFDDLDGGRMHVQNALCRLLVDADARTYRVDLAEAIAAIEADDLAHRRVWMDPALPASTREAVAEGTARRRLAWQRRDRAWYAVGLAFVVLLFMQLLGLI